MGIKFSFLSGDHPFLEAMWIWPQSYMYLYNHYADFRHDFELASVPVAAPLYISADKNYRLYINGSYVGRGPARGYQESWPYDEIEVASYLRKGHNWIAVEAYNPGISTFQYLHKTRAGMICAAKWDGMRIASNSNDWLMRRSHARRIDTARYSMQIDFQEDFDAASDDRSWIYSEVPPTGWESDILPEKAQHQLYTPLGQYPFEGMEERRIPMLREDVFVPARVDSTGIGCNQGDYYNCQNISWHFAGQELGTVSTWRKEVREGWSRNDDGLEIAIPAVGKGKFFAVTVDLGEYTVCTLGLDVRSASGGEIIDTHHFQCLRHGIPEFVDISDGCMIALANRLRVPAGNCAHEFFHIIGARHVCIVVRDVLKPMSLKLTARTALYPFTMTGGFSCSDTRLNDIYGICRRTQQICSLDAYVDTPWREQAQWWGDARVQARNTFYMDGDARLLARGIRSIAGQGTTSGLTFGHAPTSAGNCILPDFALTWILTIWDYYFQTGDISLFNEQYERIGKVLGYFADPDIRDADGLLKYDRRYWLFEDWSPLPKEGVPTFLNLWYLVALDRYAEMLSVSGRHDESKRYSMEVTARKKLITEKLFDSGKMLFNSCLNDEGIPSGTPSVHDQVLAIMLGMTPEAHSEMVKNFLLPYLRQEELDCAVPSAFWCTYLLGVMNELGYGSEVVDFIRDKWTPMLSTGTTWEAFDWTESSGWSAAHAWSAHPSYHLVNIIAGIRQTAPGWTGIIWEPCFVEGLDEASAVIPAPSGRIQSAWKRNGGKVSAVLELPEGVSADIVLPGIARHRLDGGRHEFSLNIKGAVRE